MRQRFRRHDMQKCYETCREEAAAGRFHHADGSRVRHGMMFIMYWDGRDGKRPLTLQPGTLGYAAWRAGMDGRSDAAKAST